MKGAQTENMLFTRRERGTRAHQKIVAEAQPKACEEGEFEYER